MSLMIILPVTHELENENIKMNYKHMERVLDVLYPMGSTFEGLHTCR